MRRPPQGRTVVRVPPEALRIVLDVQVDGDAIVGHARDDHGETRQFDGRLGLLAAIDTLIAGAVPESAGMDQYDTTRSGDDDVDAVAEREGAS
jgi:hypothetical protein